MLTVAEDVPLSVTCGFPESLAPRGHGTHARTKNGDKLNIRVHKVSLN